MTSSDNQMVDDMFRGSFQAIRHDKWYTPNNLYFETDVFTFEGSQEL